MASITLEDAGRIDVASARARTAFAEQVQADLAASMSIDPSRIKITSVISISTAACSSGGTPEAVAARERGAGYNDAASGSGSTRRPLRSATEVVPTVIPLGGGGGDANGMPEAPWTCPFDGRRYEFDASSVRTVIARHGPEVTVNGPRWLTPAAVLTEAAVQALQLNGNQGKGGSYLGEGETEAGAQMLADRRR